MASDRDTRSIHVHDPATCPECAGLRAEPDAGALRAALERIEFVHGICPACSGVNDPQGLDRGHYATCSTLAALASDTGGSSTAGDEP